jgi:DNA-binding HxlR family transcriptional regulator
MGKPRTIRKDSARDQSWATGCPLTAALQVLGGRWSLIALYWLAQGSVRFNDLRRRMPAISQKVLAATLRDLEREGMITRTVIPAVPPKVAYDISEYGRTVCPLIQATREWGKHHLEWRAGRMGAAPQYLAGRAG